MTDPKARRPEPPEGGHASARASAAAASQSENAAEAAPSGDDASIKSAQALAGEVAETKDRLLRTLADMENLRRRTEREVADARAYGIGAFAHDMLAVADNLRRALDAVARAERASFPAPAVAFIEGVELTERELLKALEKHGVKRFDPLGQKFDPNLHQAMFQVPDASAPAGTVVQVVQAGFMIGDRVLRPALVGVAKGGPKASSDSASANHNASEEEPQSTI